MLWNENFKYLFKFPLRLLDLNVSFTKSFLANFKKHAFLQTLKQIKNFGLIQHRGTNSQENNVLSVVPFLLEIFLPEG